MKELNDNWITEGLMDFEYKKYLLLAYLKSCRDDFTETRLYPPLGDLVRHYHHLSELNKSLEQLQQSFPKELSGFDFKLLQVEYERQKVADNHIQTITEIMEFAIPTMQSVIIEGKEIYEMIEQNMELAPVGIIPMYIQEGYVLINTDNTKDVFVYQYQHSVITTPQENLRSLSLNYIYKEVKSIGNTFERIKLNLIERFRDMPQPATYLCTSKLQLPLVETLLPITKRMMMKLLSSP